MLCVELIRYFKVYLEINQPSVSVFDDDLHFHVYIEGLKCTIPIFTLIHFRLYMIKKIITYSHITTILPANLVMVRRFINFNGKIGRTSEREK